MPLGEGYSTGVSAGAAECDATERSQTLPAAERPANSTALSVEQAARLLGFKAEVIERHVEKGLPTGAEGGLYCDRGGSGLVIVKLGVKPRLYP